MAEPTADLIERLLHPLYGEPPGGLVLKNDAARADMRAAAEGLERLSALWVKETRENERMRAAILTTACPGGGWNGMPKELVNVCTVKDCLTHDACGCDLGAAIRKADGMPPLPAPPAAQGG